MMKSAALRTVRICGAANAGTVPRRFFRQFPQGPLISSRGNYHFGGGAGCTCGLCSAATPTDKRVINLDDKDERLKALMRKNEELQREIDILRSSDDLIIDDGKIKEQDPDIAQLLENNRRWVETQKNKDPEFFNKIGAPQKPKFLYIGCSDSRVPANQILGLGPGEVFVHRNVGNQVIGSDLNVLSAVEFAVKHLKVQHIIVTGHYDCGAVHASAKKQDLGLLENWIRSIRDVYRIHNHEMSLIADPEQRHRRLVELNVIEQCLNLYKTGVVQRTRMESSKAGDPIAYPRVHAMVFDPKVGLLKKLPVDFKKTIEQFKDIYDLY